MLSLPDTATAIGLRDRAMLEVLHSTGVRRMELINLGASDIDADRGTPLVRQGKGRKDRMIPIGERALHWGQRYREEVRPDLACGADDGTLFLTTLGEAFAPGAWPSSCAATSPLPIPARPAPAIGSGIAWCTTDGWRGLVFAVSHVDGQREALVDWPMPRGGSNSVPYRQRPKIDAPLLNLAVTAALEAGWEPLSRGRAVNVLVEQ